MKLEKEIVKDFSFHYLSFSFVSLSSKSKQNYHICFQQSCILLKLLINKCYLIIMLKIEVRKGISTTSRKLENTPSTWVNKKLVMCKKIVMQIKCKIYHSLLSILHLLTNSLKLIEELYKM